MKNKLVLTTLLLALTQSLFANTTTPAPKECPSISAINSAFVNPAVKLSKGNWIVYTENHFNTNNNWLFGVTLPAEGIETTEEAITKAKMVFNQTTNVLGPFERTDIEMWGCIYLKGFYETGFAQTIR